MAVKIPGVATYITGNRRVHEESEFAGIGQ